MAVCWIRYGGERDSVSHDRGDDNVVADRQSENAIFKVGHLVAEFVGAVERDVSVPGAVEDDSVVFCH